MGGHGCRRGVQGILRQCFEDTDEIEEIVSIEAGSFTDRQRVSYGFRGHNAESPFVVERQAYCTESEGRLNYIAGPLLRISPALKLAGGIAELTFLRSGGY